jgi:AcrR family transcriptional regulator
LKTREKILHTSLRLFNEDGEPNVTTVDIANELEISPGNLYYHFRGKELIIEALYDQFDREMVDILAAPVQKNLSMQDAWFYLYVVFEHIYDYRFLYFNITDIMHRYEKIQRRFKRLIKMKQTTTKTICRDLVRHDILQFSTETEQDVLVSQIVLTALYWMNYNLLSDRMARSPEILMHEGVFQITSLISSHLKPDKKQFVDECKSLYDDLIRQAAEKVRAN